MATMKKIARYVLLLVGAYVLTGILVFIGMNANYSKIELKSDLPSQISIGKAEAKKNTGRIYGYVKNSKENNINGKSIKAVIYDDNNQIIATETLKINDVKYNEEKLFRIHFYADNAKYYFINIVD